jgi:hypothetical protein
MSGFLQRITGAAIQRQARLHPVVDSLWAAARRDESPALQFPEVTERITSTPQESRAKTTLQNEVEQGAPATIFRPLVQGREPLPRAHGMRFEETQESDPAHSSARDSRQGADSLGFANQDLHSSVSGNFQPLLERSSATRQEYGNGAEKDSERSLSEFAAKFDTAPASTRSWIYEPVINAGTPMPSRSEEGLRPNEPVPSVSALRAASRRAAASEAAQRNAQMRAPIQAEDIQIHIGRIEVIAVPPPAALPAAAPARRGQSLDEYLSRSNGRSR